MDCLFIVREGQVRFSRSLGGSYVVFLFAASNETKAPFPVMFAGQLQNMKKGLFGCSYLIFYICFPFKFR